MPSSVCWQFVLLSCFPVMACRHEIAAEDADAQSRSRRSLFIYCWHPYFASMLCCLAVQAATDAACELVDEEARRCSVNQVDVRVEARGKANDDADAQHQRSVAAVNGDLCVGKTLCERSVRRSARS